MSEYIITVNFMLTSDRMMSGNILALQTQIYAFNHGKLYLSIQVYDFSILKNIQILFLVNM